MTMLHTEFNKSAQTSLSNTLNILLSIDMEHVDPTAREVIAKLITSLSEDVKMFSEAMVDILKEADYKLLDEKGQFKKIGLLRWKNIADYASFAAFVKDKIQEVKETMIQKEAHDTNSIAIKE